MCLWKVNTKCVCVCVCVCVCGGQVLNTCMCDGQITNVFAVYNFVDMTTNKTGFLCTTRIVLFVNEKRQSGTRGGWRI